MSRHVASALLLVVLGIPTGVKSTAQETPRGKGMTDANKERLVLDDMEDVSDWYNGSPTETELSTSDKHVKQGKSALEFANVVDHTKGERNYPVGWPRTGKNLARAKLTDWSGYDYFECWIYVETSRPSLPGTPLGVGFYHAGHQRSSSVTLKEVNKDAWVKIVIPLSQLTDAADVERVQFNISESNYKHGDRVDFYIDDMVLTRLVEPVIAELGVDRKLLYSSQRQITASYTLMGSRGLAGTSVQFAIGANDADSAAKVRAKAELRGELPLVLGAPLKPGTYSASLSLRSADGKLIDRKQLEFRVIDGPFY